MPAFSSGRPVGPDGNPIDSGPPPSLLAMAQPDQPRPENQAVLNAIAQARAAHAATMTPGSGAAPFQGNEYFESAAQPGMSGYFDVGPGGNIVPHVDPARQLAAEVSPEMSPGQGLAALARSVFPSGGFGSGGIKYGVDENNDGGGFFTLQDLFNQRQGGVGVTGVPQIGTFQQSLPSTNNWRLLGRGPGWIMRNGDWIYTGSPEAASGGYIGADMGFGVTAEHGSMSARRGSALGTGAWFGAPNTWDGVSGWPGAEFYRPDRWPKGNT